MVVESLACQELTLRFVKIFPLKVGKSLEKHSHSHKIKKKVKDAFKLPKRYLNTSSKLSYHHETSLSE